MTERLLQYIWQFQYFNKSELSTVDEEPLFILHPGLLNNNQGPDFLDAKIKVSETTWAGNIELHLKTSDWNNHHHSLDKNYHNIILHVVYENDQQLNLPFPVLELKNKISKILLSRFDDLMNGRAFIPCEKNVPAIESLVWTSWKERLLVERLQKKAGMVLQCLSINNHHWEETFWWILARNFGTKVNSDAFEKIAQSLPVAILAKHKNQLHQTEALLLGQAGLLEDNFTEDYPKMLQKEYRFYKKKYRLEAIKLPLHFLRMRPFNFPTLRLAQLAMLIHQSHHLFSIIKETEMVDGVKKLLQVCANDYWHYHYLPGEPAAFKKKNLGADMINNILINTIIPVLFAYGHHHKEIKYKERALQWLQQIKAEKNNIVNGYRLLGIESSNAFDSQALLQLKNEYCDRKRCLECAVGNKLLRPTTIIN